MVPYPRWPAVAVLRSPGQGRRPSFPRGSSIPRAGATDLVNEVTDDARTPYEVLGLARNATQQEVRSAYRKLVLIYHPDKFTGTHVDEAGKITVEQNFVEIQAAYELLFDEERRAEYDAETRSTPMEDLGKRSPSWAAWLARKKKAFSQASEGLAAQQYAAFQKREINAREKQFDQLGDSDRARRFKQKLETQRKTLRDRTVIRQALRMKKRDKELQPKSSTTNFFPSADSIISQLDSGLETKLLSSGAEEQD